MSAIGSIKDHARPQESETLADHLRDIEYALSLAGRHTLILGKELGLTPSGRALINLESAIAVAENLLVEITRNVSE